MKLSRTLKRIAGLKICLGKQSNFISINLTYRNDFCYAIGFPIIASKRSERVETTLVGLPDKDNKQSLSGVALLIAIVRNG